MIIILCSGMGMLLKGCNSSTKSTDNTRAMVENNSLSKTKNTFYQYNIWWGFVNKVFEGDLTVKELKSKGDIGLGSYSNLDGELIMLDGVSYRVREDGVVDIPEDNESIVYVDAAFFEPVDSFEVQSANFDSLILKINAQLPSLNQFYALKVKGEFTYMKCGGLHKQEKPFGKGLDVLIPQRPVFEKENVKGTIVGFYCPDFIGNINVAGYHFHFISEDKTFGGHVMEFNADDLSVEYDPLLEYHFSLPGSSEFLNVTLEKEFQYQKK